MTTLKNIIRLTAAAPGVTTVAHGLNIDGVSVRPDKLETSTSGSFTVSADATNLTVINQGGVSADIDIYVEHWHTIERVFGAAGTTELAPQPFQPGAGSGGADPGVNTVRFADDGALINVYVDGVNGSDDNDGLTEATALQTIPTVYRKFPMITLENSRVRVHLAGVGGFGANATAPLTYEIWTILIGGGEGYPRGNTYQYMGPEMVPATPTTGPAIAALDNPPAVQIAGGSASAGGTRSVRFDFTGAAPGWTVDDLQGKYLRITRGGVKVTWEMPISRNTADTITVRVTAVDTIILNTDIAEIVEPGAKLETSGGIPTPAVCGDGGYANASESLGASFVRCSFPGGLSILRAQFATFDRCNLDEVGWGCFTDSSVINFFGCTGRSFSFIGTSVGTYFSCMPIETSAADPIPGNNRKFGIELASCGQYGRIEMLSRGNPNHFHVWVGLAMDYPELYDGFGIFVRHESQLVLHRRGVATGWQKPAIQGQIDDTGPAIFVVDGGRALLQSNVTTPGVVSVYCNGGGNPLHIDDGAGLSCDYGNGVGDWEEAVGYDGCLWQAPAAGLNADPVSVIRVNKYKN